MKQADQIVQKNISTLDGDLEMNSANNSLKFRKAVTVVVMGCSALTASCASHKASEAPSSGKSKPDSVTKQLTDKQLGANIAGDSSNFTNKNLPPLCGFASQTAVRAALQQEPLTACVTYDQTNGAPLGTATSTWGGPEEANNALLCRYYPNLSNGYSFEAIRAKAAVPELMVDRFKAFIIETENPEEYVQISDKTLDCVIEDVVLTGNTQPTRDVRLSAFMLELTQKLAL